MNEEKKEKQEKIEIEDDDVFEGHPPGAYIDEEQGKAYLNDGMRWIEVELDNDDEDEDG